MAEQVTVFKFSKRVNSTKQADVLHGGTTYTGNFRGPIDIMTPTIEIQTVLNEFDYNYLVWYDSVNSLRRFYWIRHKVYYPNNIVGLTLEEDILATFKDGIVGKRYFVERCATVPSELVTDVMPISKNGVSVNKSSSNVFEHYPNGWYAVGIAGSYSPAAFASSGGVYYYLCDFTTVNTLLDWLNDEGSSGEWADYDPISRVVSIRYFPISFSNYASTAAALFLHRYDDGTGTMVSTWYTWNGNFAVLTGMTEVTHDMIYTKALSISFTDHAQLTASERFLNYPPYRELILFAGPFGKIEIPLDLLTELDNSSKLHINVVFDLISGMSRLEIYFDSAKNRLVYSTEDYSMTVDTAITSQSYNKYSDVLSRDLRKTQYRSEEFSKYVGGAGALMVGAASGNGMVLGSGVALLASGAGTHAVGVKQYALDSYNLSVPDMHTKGSNGSFSMLEKPWILYTISHMIMPMPYDLLGYSCDQAVTLTDNAGYVRCTGASFENDKATLEEIVAVNDYLNSGFYLE